MNNNKPYFAKYLPIEGEIKEGDLIATKLLPNIPLGKALKEQVELGINEQGNYTLLKLFLCGRKNIKVGDEVTIIISKVNGEDVPIGTRFHVNRAYKHEVLNDNGLTLNRKDVVKVIGEISKDALPYVNEGDEFDLKDIRFQISDYPPFEGWMDVNEKDFIEIDSYIKRVQIKGSCTHYH